MRLLLAFTALTLVGCIVAVGSLSGDCCDLPRGAIAVLMYHHVSSTAESPAVVKPEMLEEHITAVLEAGFEVMTLDSLSEWLDEPDDQTSGVIFTFDDGYDSFYHQVFPLLRKYRVPASCFLIVSSSERASGPMSTGQNACPHLTFAQVQEMLKEGAVEFGSHSYDGHKYVETGRGSRPCLVEPLVDEDYTDFVKRVSMDLVKSRQVMERVTGRECRYFSYPYGWATDSLKGIVRQCGFDLALTTRHGAIVAGADRYALPRIAVRPEMTGADLVKVVASAMLGAMKENSLHEQRAGEMPSDSR